MRMQPISRALLGCGLGLVLSAGLAPAQEVDLKLPEGLKHVPPDAMGFLYFRAGDFLKSPLGKTVLQELRQDREASKGLQEIEKTLGIEAANLESITLLMLPLPSPAQMNPWDGPAIRKERFERDFRKMGAEKDAAGMRKRRAEMDAKDKFDKEQADKDAKEREEKKQKEEKNFDETKLDAGTSPVLFMERAFEQPERDPREVANYLAMSRPLVIVCTTKPLDRKKILRAQLFPARPGNIYDRDPERDPTILFLSDRTVLIGKAWDVARYSEVMARKPGPKAGPLQAALALGAKEHLVVAGGSVPPEVRRMVTTPFNVDLRALAVLSPLLHTEAALALDIGKGVDLTMHYQAPTEASVAHALQAVKNLRVLAELALEKSREAGESGGWKLDLEKGLAKALADAVIEQKGLAVHAQLKLEVSPAVVKRFTQDIVSTLRHNGDRSQSLNNLKQIGLALHGYHDANKSLPPAGLSSINDPMGKPLLSWRVAILPYIDQAPLYQQFDLTASWDSPQNKKLIAKMPEIYVLPGAETKEGETHYRVLVGPRTMFERRQGGRGIRLVEVVDGTSNTFMAVEAKEPTIWTKPDDLPFDPKGPLPKFGASPDGFNVLMGDGTVRFVRSTIPQDVLRSYIIRNSGQVRGPLD